MNYQQQKVKSIHFKRLKNLKDIQVSLEQPLTALMGTNGSGKSTILHALACCYKPIDDNLPNYKFSQFFTPTVDSIWQGSEFVLNHSYRNDKDHEEVETAYSKKSDRWTPRYERRVGRTVFYIGINTAVPIIEEEKAQSFINYQTQILEDDLSQKIKDKAGYIMNRDYSSYNLLNSKKKKYIGVEYNSIKYSSLSMSAGEQRVFYIISQIFNAPKYSLILIDEIDLLLHVSALKKLIKVIYERAEDKNLQIVFTTHSLDILNMIDFVKVYYLDNTLEKTLCLENINPDMIYEISGDRIRPIKVYVEDDLAEAIIASITESLKISRYVEIIKFGAAINAFSVASGLMISNKLSEEMIFVLDGDEYKTDEEKTKRIDETLTGTSKDSIEMRKQLKGKILQFNLPNDMKPESYLHKLLKELPQDNEITNYAKTIRKEEDTHKYVDEIIYGIGFSSKEVGLSKVIDTAKDHLEWDNFIEPIKNWLIETSIVNICE
ncbi:AAA family ATPase [Lysinibacillus sp. G4S2]|uniref:ATP-dependent nuclease n=1 Tax=Lysinibacillus sp. G4S2 TaxID=3055859 RepID=UPI0025A28CF5|nr:AAA family ATPase [Lysinibacillus sp. G4S2]MDM5251005.1 AAA family ATPase [Lysinibacillus sp. G4S2]